MSSQKTSSEMNKAPRRVIRIAGRALGRMRLPNARKTISNIVDEQSLINLESELGAAVFGQVPTGSRREFFYHRHNLWIYHEQIGIDGFPLTVTYEVHDDRVEKILPDRTTHILSGEELDNFLAAARTYQVLVEEYLYNDLS